MVERIVVAGRTVLVSDGYDAFSTNRVAETAGISPGSLYQYFDDKTAILDVVVDRYTEETAERVAAALSERMFASGWHASAQDLAANVRGVVDALVSALEADRELLRVVTEELPLTRSRPRRDALERRVTELVATFLAARPGQSRRPRPSISTWLTVLAIETLVTRWVLDQPNLSRDELLDEIVALVDGYLLS